MASILVTNDPVHGYNIININWSDVPTITYARVVRIAADGTETVVRVHTYSTGDGYIKLSAGLATVYDTEVPLDVPVSYRTEGYETYFPSILDTFTRTVANGWGNADSGQLWTSSGTAAANFSVAGGFGLNSVPAAAVAMDNRITLGVPDQRAYATVSVPVVPTGAAFRCRLLVRRLTGNTYYQALLEISTGANVTIQIRKSVNGTSTTIASAVSVGTHTPGATWGIACEADGSTVQAKAWLVSSGEPPGWNHSVTDTSIAYGDDVSIITEVLTGNTNAPPTVFSWDNFSALGLSGTSAPMVTSSVSVLASGGDMWIKAPLRPWADRRVTQTIPETPDCVPDSAIYFAGMDEEGRSTRSNVFIVNNRKNPIAASRIRAGITSMVRYVSRSFVDRDALIALNAEGDPLLFQGPPAYGIPDRYMMVGEYQISRLSTDHKQQGRMHTMPHTEVDRPPGLADGVLGVRWMDLCDRFTTFGDAETGGLTWTGVMLGYGSSPTPTLYRIYADIPIDFATYGDIPTGGRTYEDLAEDR